MNNEPKEFQSNYFQNLSIILFIYYISIAYDCIQNESSINNTNIDVPHTDITQIITAKINSESSEEIPMIVSEPQPLIKLQFTEEVDGIYEKMKSYLLKEKAKIQREMQILNTTKKYFRQFQRDERKLIKLEKENFLSKMKLVEPLKESDIIDINIGGTHNIATTRGTLTKFRNSGLGILFSGQINHINSNINNKGTYFIDREGDVFINLIRYLRNGKFPIFKNSIEELKFYTELSFWNIPLYQEKCITPQFIFDILWCSNTFNMTSFSNKLLITKSNPHHEIACCIPCLGDISTYIEFNIVINGTFNEKNQVFIGLIDKSKHKRIELVSYAGKRCPLAYYWDIWNSRLIKTVNNGIFIGYKGEYGCGCKCATMKIGMKYDYKARTINYYLNDINLGVAFTNIQSSLCPAVDMWFDSGIVEILLSKGQWKDKEYL